MLIDSDEISRPLTEDNINLILKKIVHSISARAKKAYLFGSAARKDFSAGSDIDLIIVKETDEKFVRRAFEFEDLFELYPRLDILVYTPVEFSEKIKKNTPFWEDFRRQAVQLL
jgi:predicted nucleotidyltransferase